MTAMQASFLTDFQQDSSISIVDDLHSLAIIQKQWDLLAQRSVTKNVFYESMLLIPALQHLPEAKGVKVALFRHPETGELIGLFPFVVKSRFKSLPIKTIENFCYSHCYLGEPLIDERYSALCASLILKFARQYSSVITLNRCYENSTFTKALIKEANKTSCSVNLYDQFERAALFDVSSGEEYLKKEISSKKRKEWRRLHNRLEEQGKISYVKTRNVDAIVENFLSLEKSGWKGKINTAMSSKVSDRKFFSSAIKEASIEGAFSCCFLKVDEKNIAGLLMFIRKNFVFTFKIAYDEEFGKFSPGVLLMNEVTRFLPGYMSGMVADSCATRDHPMINHIWRNRVSLVSPQIGIGNPLARSVVGGIDVMKKVKNAVRSFL